MRVRSRFYRWPWKVPVEHEVEEELAFHLEMRTRELESAGMAPDAARHEAERRLDAPRMRSELRALARGRDRHMERTQYFDELRQDIAFSVRGILKRPGFAAIAVVTLALGIGATTAIFSALYAVVLKPLPLHEPDRLFAVGETFRGALSTMSAGVYVDAAERTSIFEGLAALNSTSYNLSEGLVPERIMGARVTANYFSVLGASPLAGRTFTAEEDQPGRERVVVLSYRLWQRRFGGAPIVGREIRMNGTPHTVVGIMPRSFDLSAGTEDLWTPIAFTPERRRMHDEHFLMVYGRLKAGVTVERALAELEAAAATIRREFAHDVPNLKFSMAPYDQQFVGNYRARLFVLMGAVALVLLIACGNVANLLLARGSARAREIAIRSAIGAGRWRIVRQLLTESVVLGSLAAGAGVALAYGLLQAAIAWGPTGIPRLEQARVDPLALAFTAIVALLSSLVCGLVPALRLARADDVQSTLHEGGRGSTGRGVRDRVRAGLIVAEVALSLMLLVGAGLLIRSALALQQVDLGFDPSGVMTARFTLPEQTYADPAREADVVRRVGEAVRAIPGVSAATVSTFAAMGPGGGSNGLVPEGSDPNDHSTLIQSTLRLTTSDFFAAMRTPILKGRAFNDDDRAGGQKVMIVSESLAKRAFPGQDPLGKRIACCESMPDRSPVWKVVVGVAGDIRSRGPAAEPQPEFYLPWPQAPKDAWGWFRTFYVIARADGDPSRLAPPLRDAMARIDPDVPLFDLRTMDQRLVGTLATARFNTLLLTMLGVIGLVLAGIGIYGVVSYLVGQRTQEIGVRMALGATSGSVVALLIRQAMKPVVIGASVGLLGALGATSVLTSQLFEVSRTDPVTIAVVTAALIAVALVAAAVPARRAAAVDPTRALQAE